MAQRCTVTAFDGVRTTLPGADERVSRGSRDARAGRSASPCCSSCCLSGGSPRCRSSAHFEVRTITAGTMPLAFLAMAQSVIVIAGGIDLSVGAQMVFANCLSALWMEDHGFGACLGIAVAVLRGQRGDRRRDRRDHHRVGRARHHRHARRQLHDLGPGPVHHRRTGRRHVDRLPALRRRPPRQLLAVGAVDRRRAGGGVAPAAREPSRPGHLRHRQRPQGGVPVGRVDRPHPGRRRTPSAGCSPASPAS